MGGFTRQILRLPWRSRKRMSVWTQRGWKLPASCQVRFEEAAVHCLQIALAVPSQTVVMGGGCSVERTWQRAFCAKPLCSLFYGGASGRMATWHGRRLWCL